MKYTIPVFLLCLTASVRGGSNLILRTDDLKGNKDDGTKPVLERTGVTGGDITDGNTG